MSSGKTYKIEVEDVGFTSVLKANGEFRCAHENAIVVENVMDQCWDIDCADCGNEDLTESDMDELIDNYVKYKGED